MRVSCAGTHKLLRHTHRDFVSQTVHGTELEMHHNGFSADRPRSHRDQQIRDGESWDTDRKQTIRIQATFTRRRRRRRSTLRKGRDKKRERTESVTINRSSMYVRGTRFHSRAFTQAGRQTDREGRSNRYTKCTAEFVTVVGVPNEFYGVL